MGSVLPVYRLQCFRAVTGGVNHRREEGKDGGGREKGGFGPAPLGFGGKMEVGGEVILAEKVEKPPARISLSQPW